MSGHQLRAIGARVLIGSATLLALNLAVGGGALAGALVLSSAPNPGDTLDFKFGGYTEENTGVTLGNSGGHETTWGVGYVTELDDHSTGDTQLWVGNGNNPQNTSVDYILYGIADDSFTPGAPNTLNNSGCTVNNPGFTGCDGKIHIDFYTENGTDPVRSNSLTPASRSGFSTVNGISNGPGASLLMSWVLTPGDINDTNDQTTTLVQYPADDTLPTTGVGDFLADCVSGPGCALFQGGKEQLNGSTLDFGDILGQFTLSSSLTGSTFGNGFEGFINDPAQSFAASAAPEPGSALLFGAGLLGLVALTRRVQQKRRF